MSKIPHRLYLTEDQMPQKWFNLRSAMAEQPDPLLHPGTLRPLGVDDLSPIFCEELARQELDGATAYVDIPEPIQNVYKTVSDAVNRFAHQGPSGANPVLHRLRHRIISLIK